MNKKLRSVLCLLLCLCMVLSLAACKKGGDKETTGAALGEKVTYTVRVLNQADGALENVGVYIYEDSTLAELVWYDATNEAGEISFEEKQSDSYVAVLADVPTGYAVEEYYPLTSLTTEIRLSAGAMTGDEEITYKLGDMMMDFTVTDTEGNEISLLKLLEEKQAVILNFYYNDCVPCQMEFPYLQEAYEEYADKIAVLAMNPIDDAEAVAKFREEMKLTFPMAACDIKWEEYMQLTAYPTTVVIDRFGNIVLIHKGSVESAQTFKDVFAAVTGDEYEQKLYDSIDDIETTAEEGSAENPTEMGATPSFELTIEGGKEHYIKFYKLNNLTLRIKDPDVYVIYNDQKYTPKNGVVSLIVTCPDMNTPAKIGFGNSSDETKTFTVTMASQPGTLDNPYSLVLGENKVKIAAGNQQGVYYTWTAKENGTLKVWCTSATSGVKYDCSLFNTADSAMRSMSADSADEEGKKVVSVVVNKGDLVQMIAAVLPDESWVYRAGNFTYVAEFTPGAGRDTTKVEMTTYTVNVTDEAGNPLTNVNFNTVVEEKATAFSSKEGVATISLPTGTYKVTMIVPEGYTSDVTEFTLTKEAPEYTIKLKTKVIVMVDYTVTVVDANGDPVADTTVIIGDKFANTDAQGKAVFNLEQGAYTVKLSAPEGYVAAEDSYSFPENETALTVTLEYAPGTVNKPITITELQTVTDPIAAGKTVYYNLFRMSGMILTINDADAKITIDEQTYEADENGKLVLTVPNTGSPFVPTTMQLTNGGQQTEMYTILLSYPMGHLMNPQILETLGELNTDLAEGDEDGYYYSWTAAEEGVVTFYVASATEGVIYDISLTNNTNSANRTLSADGNGGLVSLNVAAGDTVSIQVLTSAFDAEDNYVGFKAAQIVSMGSFTAQENTEDAKLTYSVIVNDAAGNPMSGVSVTIGNTQLTTDENGMAYALLVEGSYIAKITVPSGYKAETTQFTLTTDVPQATATLTPVVMVDYKVNLTYAGAAYTGETKVQILSGTQVVYEETTTAGSVTANLAEGDYTVKLTLSDGTLTYDMSGAQLSASAPSVTINLTKLKTYTDYKVTVTDMNGKVQSGILVQILKGAQIVATGNTDANGQITKNLETGDYTVALSFGSTAYYYNKETAVLTGSSPNLTIRLASEPDENNTMALGAENILNGGSTYVLNVGGTHVQLSTGKAYYSGAQETYFFIFAPTQAGSYRIALDNSNAPLYYWGTTAYQYRSTAAAGNEDNALHISIQDGQVGNIEYVIGIEAVEGITDVAILITREGEPDFDISTVPWNNDWQSDYVPVKQTVNAKKITYVDITAATSAYTIVYNESDGFYHLNSATGPVLYMNLGTVTVQKISLNNVINGDGSGAGGAPIRSYFYDEEGKFVKKEDYTELLIEYIGCADARYGLYPVTKDLAYMVQNGGMSWWDSTSPNYILTGCNPELGWLFACCTIE